MGGKSGSSTVGYKYYAGFQMIIARYIDRLYRIRVDQKTAWSGTQIGSGLISVNQPDLFGGANSSDPEGGIVGDINFQTGVPTQTADTWLQGKIGEVIPAYRGAAAIVAHDIYLGNNPYMKEWDFRPERIHTLDDGSPQWYDAKAAIHSSALYQQLGPTSDGWKYLDVTSADTADYSSPSFDDSSWSSGASPFASATGHPYAGLAGFPNVVGTHWPLNTNIWVRRHFTLDAIVPVSMNIFVDNYATVWCNGVLVLPRIGNNETPSVEAFQHQFVIPVEALILGENLLVCKAEDQGTYSYAAFSIADGSTLDMNPSHMLRECLINGEWGMGYELADLNMDSFTAVADTLFNESFGLSYFWDDSTTDISAVVEDILAHVDGQLYVDRQTQLWNLVLIRDDYDQDTLPEFTDGVDIMSMDSFSRPGFMDLINQITVSYYNPAVSDSGSLNANNPALFLQQGVILNKQNDYDMCCSPTLASRLAQRDLANSGNPLATGTLYLLPTDAANLLHRGSVCKLNFAKYSLVHTVVRVTAISFGDGVSRRIKMSFVEDRFAMPDTAITSTAGSGWVNPGSAPAFATNRLAMEIPYAYLLKSESASAIASSLAADPGAGYMGVASLRPGNSSNAAIYVDSGAGYVTTSTLDYCAGGLLSAPIGYLDATLTLVSPEDLNEIAAGTYFQIDNEIMGFGSVAGSVFTGVTRGLFDTVPKPHAANAPVFFIENYLDGDNVDYTAGESLNIKLVSRFPSGPVALGGAPVDAVSFAGRLLAPYAPGNVKIGGAAYPTTVSGAFTVTWASRNRLSQDTTLVPTTAGDVAPEPNTRYGLRLLDSTNTLLVEQTNIGLGTAAVVLNYTGQVTMQLYSIDDNGRSIQQHELSFAYTPPGGTVVTAITATAYTPVDNTTIISGGSA